MEYKGSKLATTARQKTQKTHGKQVGIWWAPNAKKLGKHVGDKPETNRNK